MSSDRLWLLTSNILLVLITHRAITNHYRIRELLDENSKLRQKVADLTKSKSDGKEASKVTEGEC